ncbi:DUF2953 domain-containing protein [Virgibacillus sp. W0430]|uniref:DUF2953 domain-containing protein n=1 Tax=Virgibacillus sp. W0430 TaxID=3391580 RepID=UPI003F4778C6
MIVIIGVLIGLITFFLCSRLYVHCNFVCTLDAQVLTVHVYFIRVPIYKKVITVNDKQPRQQKKNMSGQYAFKLLHRKSKRIFQRLTQMKNSAVDLLQNIEVHELKWHTNIGTGDASSTGQIAGSLWGIKNMMLRAIVKKRNTIEQSIIYVFPNYTHVIFQTMFNSIVSINAGKAIAVLYRIIKNKKNHKRM